MSFRIDGEKLLENYQTIWNQTEDLKNIGLNVLTLHDDRQIKSKIRTFGHRVYTNIRVLKLFKSFKM